MLRRFDVLMNQLCRGRSECRVGLNERFVGPPEVKSECVEKQP
jgi:hypothetical protein